MTGWQAYLSATPSSPLVLTCLNTIVGSLNVSYGGTVGYGNTLMNGALHVGRSVETIKSTLGSSHDVT